MSNKKNDQTVTTTNGKTAYPADSKNFNEDARKRVDENERKHENEQPQVLRFYTEDGTPVEPSTLPPKHEMAVPDADKRDDVHARKVDADQADTVTNESELKDK